MTRLIYARIMLALVGVAVWGYGQRIESAPMRIAGMVILAAALLLRFAPKRWFNENDRT